ncbi:hypothetical protein JYQ62_22335 [Nostoc sp. UHCC 0702]|nr:hypothetical protein JYQ62_22335 [Nostoc sp. UHCC 0702]
MKYFNHAIASSFSAAKHHTRKDAKPLSARRTLCSSRETRPRKCPPLRLWVR